MAGSRLSSGRPPKAPRLALSRRHAAEAAGVTTRTIGRWIRDGLPSARVGRRRLVPVGPFAAWLAEHRPGRSLAIVRATCLMRDAGPARG
jgi:excisionase family DNA binding protein